MHRPTVPTCALSPPPPLPHPPARARCSINWQAIVALGGDLANAGRAFFESSSRQITGGLTSLRNGLRAVFQPVTTDVCVPDPTRTGDCALWAPSVRVCSPPYPCGGGGCSTTGGACTTSCSWRSGCKTRCDPIVTRCDPIQYCENCGDTPRTCLAWAPVLTCAQVCVANCF